MASATFCAAKAGDVVIIKARVVEHCGDWMRVVVTDRGGKTDFYVGTDQVIMSGLPVYPVTT